MTKTIEPRTLAGFRDFLPEVAAKRQWLKNKLIEIFESWGYDPMETPTLEYLELFTGQIGDDEKLFYKFKDNGGRDVALRYDQTIPSVRVVSQYKNQIVKPFKRYQIQPNFRAEKPQRGRYREFIQCDVDIFGDPTPYADAETIAVSIDIYRKLGFKDVKVLINDRNLMKGIPYEAISAIDKIKKIGDQGVIEEMTKKGISLPKAKEYLATIKSLQPSEAIKIIFNYLKSCGFEESWYAFEPTIARSFSYSQGPIWEVVSKSYTAGSLMGGERYDGLFMSLFGEEMYGTGFAIGLDRTFEAAELLGLIPSFRTNSKVLVTVFSNNLFDKSIEITKMLRDQAINTETYPNPNIKLDKQLKYADQKGIPFVVIIGPDEAVKNMVTIKNLMTKSQQTVTLDACVKLITQSSL